MRAGQSPALRADLFRRLLNQLSVGWYLQSMPYESLQVYS